MAINVSCWCVLLALFPPPAALATLVLTLGKTLPIHELHTIPKCNRAPPRLLWRRLPCTWQELSPLSREEAEACASACVNVLDAAADQLKPRQTHVSNTTSLPPSLSPPPVGTEPAGA